MKGLWSVILLVPLLVSCVVPLGYTPARAEGYVSDSPSAQYLQLSLDAWRKGSALRDAHPDDDTLRAGLAPLEAEFQTKVARLTSPGASDELVAAGDDTGVLRRSLVGVALGQVRAATARGVDTEAAGAFLEQEFRRVVEAESGGRGLYVAQQSVWPENTVRYRWASVDSPSPAHRKALVAAMDAWTTATGGRVNFAVLDSSVWNDFQVTIGVLGCVELADADLGGSIVGRATVGYQGGLASLKLERSLPEGPALQRTCLHELGHVLGLFHEHQRPDRDQWIDVASAGYTLGAGDLGKLDETIDALRWREVQVRVGPWSVSLYYPVWWRERYAVTVGPFDLKSVMIYSGFLTLQPWTDGTGVVLPPGSKVPWNTELSAGDAAAIRAMYP